MAEIKGFGIFWWECFKMWLNWIKPTSPYIATVSLMILLLSILLKRIGNLSGISDTVTTYAFWMAVLVLAMMLLLVAPYKKWKKDMVYVASLKVLRDSQHNELRSNPSTYLDIRVQRISLHDLSQGSDGYADVDFYVNNGTVFSLDFQWDCGGTSVSTRRDEPVSLTKFPIISKSIDELPAGRHSNQLKLRQQLTKSDVKKLLDTATDKLTRWKFTLKVTFSFEGQLKPKMETYQPEWEGIHPEVLE